jgi:Tfp pilus assembly protein PilN
MTDERSSFERRIGDLEEDTEQRMHSVADILPDPDAVHERADRLSERAQKHHRHARALEDSDD